MTTKEYIFARLATGPLFKRNERDYSMFFMSSFGTAHTVVNEKYARGAITLAFMVFRGSVSSYYRLAKDDEALMQNIVKSILENPAVKDEIFKNYGDAGEALHGLYKRIEQQADFDADFILQLSRQLHKILIGQICILHRADSFLNHFATIPGLFEEIGELRKKYETAFGYFETNLEKLFTKILFKIPGATMQNLKLLTPEEIIQSLASSLLPAQAIQERTGLAIVNYLPQPEIIVGAQAVEVYAAIQANEAFYNPVASDVLQVRGQTVFGVGKITGTCRVIIDYDTITDLKEGVILVAPSTLPKYNAIYQRAKAIVTNEGGILAHAAILCREFKIPGVVGTKIATQVLHDGDLVEVDAENGVVRVIERAKTVVA